jgi:hypothetical protein
MTEQQIREHQIEITRYRLLELEVTDPLAACLLHHIVEELEANLRETVYGSAPCEPEVVIPFTD